MKNVYTTVKHLEEVAKTTLEEFGIPPELHEGAVHHNGGRWSEGTVYTLRCERGVWALVKIEIQEQVKDVMLFELAPEIVDLARNATNSRNAIHMHTVECYQEICDRTLKPREVR